MVPVRAALIGIVAVALAGCAAGTSNDGQAPESLAVAVTLDDDMSVEMSETEFVVGQSVTFEVTNAGAVPHELYLGDEAAQAEHAEEMDEMDGMGHDEPGGVSVAPGATETLEYTFNEAGEILAGCHEPGHYEAGMVRALVVNP